MKKKIAIFLTIFSSGGIEAVVKNLSSYLVKKNFEVDLVLSDTSGPYIKAIHPEVRIIDLQASRTIYSFPNLFRYIQKEKPYLLLTCIEGNYLVAFLANVLAGHPTRLVHSVHIQGSLLKEDGARFRNHVVEWLMRIMFPRMRNLIVVSEGMKKRISEKFGVSESSIHVIYNPIDTKEIYKKSQEPVLHHWFEKGAPPVVLAVGRLAHAKDFSTLIRAFALIRKKRNIRLMILGEGDEKEKLEKLSMNLGIEKDVALPGFIKNPYAYMARAKVFVLSSRMETFSIVLVEAMACGTPVISTDCPFGPSEILENGKWGELVPAGNTEALAETIIKTLDQPKNSSSSLQKRAKDFDIAKIGDSYLSFLEIC